MRYFLYTMIIPLFICTQACATSSCDHDIYLDLNYPAGLQITNLHSNKKMDPGYVHALNQHIGHDVDYRAPGAPANTGMIWIPKEACGKKDLDLFITLHGWRSFGSAGSNIYLKSPDQKNVEKYVTKYLRETKDAAGENAPVIRPIVIAAPMHDRGPHDTVFGPEYYNINEHISRIETAIKDAGLDLEFKRVSISAHSNSVCARGGLNAAEQLDQSKYQLYFVGLNDGTCGGGKNGIRKGYDFLSREPMINTPKDACLFHMFASSDDHVSSDAIKKMIVGQSPDPQANLKSEYLSTWHSSNKKIYTYRLRSKGRSGKIHNHTTTPENLFDEILPRFFAVHGRTDECLPE